MITMASVISRALFLSILICAALLISPSVSLNCTSQKFKSNKLFTNCTELPSLNSSLHFTHNSADSSLSIAFVAPPAKPDGWVSWAINPTATGMVGSQALIAFKSNGSLIAKTYNISSYGPPEESKLSFDAWDLSTETDGEKFMIFATVKVPEKTETVNQVWQVGASVNNGVPGKHEMEKANLDSKGLLKFAADAGGALVPSPAEAPSGDKKNGVSKTGRSKWIWVIGLLIYWHCSVLYY